MQGAVEAPQGVHLALASAGAEATAAALGQPQAERAVKLGHLASGQVLHLRVEGPHQRLDQALLELGALGLAHGGVEVHRLLVVPEKSFKEDTDGGEMWRAFR